MNINFGASEWGAIIWGAMVISFILFLYVGTNKNNRALVEELKAKYRDKKIYLCEEDEEVDTNVIQLYGYPVNVSIRSGMSIMDQRGMQFVIKEVYADDETPEKPNAEINAHSGRCALVIETSHWNHKGFRERIKKEKMIGLSIR